MYSDVTSPRDKEKKNKTKNTFKFFLFGSWFDSNFEIIIITIIYKPGVLVLDNSVLQGVVFGLIPKKNYL